MPARSTMPARPGSGRAEARHVIPYDHAATFRLEGRPGRVVQDVINVGPDGSFVATAVGYGFEEERGRALPLPAPGPGAPGDITLGQLPPDVLVEGLRINPRHEALWFTDAAPGLQLGDEDLSPTQLGLALQHVRPVREDLSFLFTLADSASGRELQDEPALNLASLGGADGRRPFRPLAQPVQFMPRSTVRLQVEERSFDRRGTLFIVLFGHKLLTSSVCPEPMRGATRSPLGPPSIDQIVPFDYVARVELQGRPGTRVETEIPVSSEGAFVATAIGYGLAPEDRRVPVDLGQLARVRSPALALQLPPLPMAAGAAFDLRLLPLRCLGAQALLDGLRIKPDLVPLVLAGGQLGTLPHERIGTLFETLNRPEDVSFRYALHDGGVGTELQNQPLHNLAGLGSADGQRPFKRLAPPMQLFPRATLRLTVQEHSGRGTLFFALHGFKRLDVPAAAAPARQRRP